ncbi:hypothetical protein LCGC14_1996190, partial [marine sediment metagenome]
MYEERIREFKVNEYITLKLENGKTNIYVTGKLFKQCKYLLIKIPISDIASFEDIESIDEAAKRLNHSLENNISEYTIPPEVEFWGHSSNLQAWYENGYDLRLLHSNLAFPLLKKLTDVGDPHAKQLFKEELTKRLTGGAYSVMELLVNKNYFKLFNRDELWSVLEDLHNNVFRTYNNYISVKYYFLKKLIEMGDKVAEKFFKDGILKSLSKGFNSIVLYFYEMGYINYISRDEFWRIFGADGMILYEIEQYVKKYEIIAGKKIYKNQLDGFEYFKLHDDILLEYGPMIFTFEGGKITGIGIFGNEKEVSGENPDLCGENMGNLELKRLPDSIGRLISLKSLKLCDIGLKKLPRSMMSLKNLKFLSLTGNPQLKLPDFLWELKSLELLDLSNNNLTTITDSIKKLENISELHLFQNYLKSFPKQSFEKLKNLKFIGIGGKKYLRQLDEETLEWLKK